MKIRLMLWSWYPKAISSYKLTIEWLFGKFLKNSISMSLMKRPLSKVLGYKSTTLQKLHSISDVSPVIFQEISRAAIFRTSSLSATLSFSNILVSWCSKFITINQTIYLVNYSGPVTIFINLLQVFQMVTLKVRFYWIIGLCYWYMFVRWCKFTKCKPICRSNIERN